MTTTWDDVHIQRAPSGAVVVEPAAFPTEAIEQAAIPVVGGTLFVDVNRPTRPPRAFITDPYWAQTWLPGVYGEQVADDVARFEDPDHDEQHDRTPARDYLSDAVERLGVGFWLHRWWPSGAPGIPELDERLLEIEIGALAWYAEALFTDLEPTVALLEPHCELLIRQVELLRRGDEPAAASDLGILNTALQAVVELLDEDTPGVAECRAMVELLAQEDEDVRAGLAAVDWSDPIAMLWDIALRAIPTPASLVLTPRGDGAAPGPRLRAVRTGRDTVDPRQVPPRTVRRRPDNLSWRIGLDPDDTVVLEVRVEAAAHPPDAEWDALLARIHLGGPPHVLTLEHDPVRRAFVGSRALPLRTVPQAAPFIDVFDPAYMERPRADRDAVAREIESIARLILERARGIASGAVSAFVAERKARRPDA